MKIWWKSAVTALTAAAAENAMRNTLNGAIVICSERAHSIKKLDRFTYQVDAFWAHTTHHVQLLKSPYVWHDDDEAHFNFITKWYFICLSSAVLPLRSPFQSHSCFVWLLKRWTTSECKKHSFMRSNISPWMWPNCNNFYCSDIRHMIWNLFCTKWRNDVSIRTRTSYPKTTGKNEDNDGEKRQ